MLGVISQALRDQRQDVIAAKVQQTGLRSAAARKTVLEVQYGGELGEEMFEQLEEPEVEKDGDGIEFGES